MKNKQTFKVVGGVVVVIAIAMMFMGPDKDSKVTKVMTLEEEVLQALVNNDQKSFEKWVNKGGNIQSALPKIEGKTYTVAEGMVYYQRPTFMKFIQTKKIPLVVQDKTTQREHDIVSLAVKKNDPEMMKMVLAEKPKLDLKYGKDGHTLLHVASTDCADKTVGIIHKAGMKLDAKATDGSSPLTLAAAKSCLGVLNYWKENKADFTKKDVTGKAAMDILKENKAPAIQALANSIAQVKRTPAEIIPNFYNKRKFPKDRLVEKNYMLEPEDRPEEAYETADYSEFAD